MRFLERESKELEERILLSKTHTYTLKHPFQMRANVLFILLLRPYEWALRWAFTWSGLGLLITLRYKANITYATNLLA